MVGPSSLDERQKISQKGEFTSVMVGGGQGGREEEEREAGRPGREGRRGAGREGERE